MKQILSLLFIVVLSSNTLWAKHVPKRIMLHYCSEVASAEYNIPLEAIDTQMPVYRKEGFTVQGTIRHPHRGVREQFICRYDGHGKFMQIKKKHPNYMQQIKKRMKHACKEEASIRWRRDKRDIRITHMTKRNENRFEIRLDAPDATGTCLVNKAGDIYRFNTTYKQRALPEAARLSCLRRASLLWHIPAPFIQINRSEYAGNGRYFVTLKGAMFRAKCEVSDRGTILRFDDRLRR